MSQITLTDSLTGLLNRNAFDDAFKTHMQSANEDGQPISLAFLDIDHFLQINEAFGHAGGDQVLQSISTILQEQAGEDAIAARYGGDEFAMIFPQKRSYYVSVDGKGVGVGTGA